MAYDVTTFPKRKIYNDFFRIKVINFIFLMRGRIIIKINNIKMIILLLSQIKNKKVI